MFCGKCGKEIIPGAKFCAGCGNPVSMQTEEKATVSADAPVEDIISMPLQESTDTAVKTENADTAAKAGNVAKKGKKKKKSKFKIIIIIFAILVLILAGGAGYFYFASPIREVMDAVEYQDYEEAAYIYNADVDENAIYRMICSVLLENKINAVEADYMEDAMSYEDAYEMLSAMQDLDNSKLSALAEEQLDRLQDLHTNRELFEQAEKLSEDGNLKEALKLYQRVADSMPEFENVLQKVDETRSNYKEAVLDRSAELETQEEYKAALNMLSEALQLLGEDTDLVQRSETVTDEYHALVKKEAILLANENLNQKNYINALDKVRAALVILPEDDELSELYTTIDSAYKEVLKEEIKTDAEEAAGAGDYPKAISILRPAVEEYPDDEELETLLKVVLENYQNEVISRVNELVAKEQYFSYIEAMSLVSEAVRICPENTVLASLEQDMTNNKPIMLIELNPTESGNYFEATGDELIEATIGAVYSPDNLFFLDDGWTWGDETAYAEYYLGGQYEKLKCIIAIQNVNEGSKKAREVEILGDDGVVLFASGGLTRSTSPFEVEIDVSGVTWLQIKSEAVDGSVTPMLIYPVLFK